jgi:hypothetical protein
MYSPISVFKETIGRVTFDLEIEWCQFEPDFDDAECVAYVNAGIEVGNLYAWFDACVIATLRGQEVPINGNAANFHERVDITGIGTIGACSYGDLSEFMRDYYQELRADALRDLEANLEHARGALAAYETPDLDSDLPLY